jgi:hypothetical protein
MTDIKELSSGDEGRRKENDGGGTMLKYIVSMYEGSTRELTEVLMSNSLKTY